MRIFEGRGAAGRGARVALDLLVVGMRLNHKRLGLLCGKAARACARVLELTSARLDLLTILLAGERIQVELAAVLCVTEPVVSRMIRSLEELGWIWRRRDLSDRRCKIVALTREGMARLAPYLDADYHRDPSGQTSAQCEGESVWLRDWAAPLARAGVSLDTFDDHDAADLLFRPMQRWNRAITYDSVFNWWNPRHEWHPAALD